MEDIILTDVEIAAENAIAAVENAIVAAENAIKAKEIFDALNASPVVVEETPVVDETPTV